MFLRLLLSFLKICHQYFSVQKLLLPVTKYMYMHVCRSFVFWHMCMSITNVNRIICYTNCTCLAQLMAPPKLSMDLVCNFPLQLISLGKKSTAPNLINVSHVAISGFKLQMVKPLFTDFYIVTYQSFLM